MFEDSEVVARHAAAALTNIGATGTGAMSARRKSSLRRLNAARDLIHARYFEELHLAQLAAAANMSLFHFSRAFRAAFGKSPLQEIVELRVNLAEHLLLGTRIEIRAIARAVGFDSRSTLFRHFVRLRNESPLAMRHRQRREQAEQAQMMRLCLRAGSPGALAADSAVASPGKHHEPGTFRLHPPHPESRIAHPHRRIA